MILSGHQTWQLEMHGSTRKIEFFPECVARVPVSLWGSGGWGCVRSTLRSRSQPFATVRVRTVWPCLWEVLQRWSFLEVSDVSLLRFAWQAWHFVTFRRVLQRVEFVLRGRRNTFVTFSEDVLQFSWQAQHFGRVHRHFSWQAQHFRRVLLRVFLQIALAGLRQVATRCKFRGRRGILCDVLKIDGSLARNIDFEVANFQVLRKTRRKTSILKLQSVKIGGSLVRNARFRAPTCLVSSLWFSRGFAVSMGELQNLSFCHVANCENCRKSRTKCWFFCIHVSCLESLVFLWRRRVYGGSWKTSPLRMCPSKLSCRFAWQAGHFVTFQPVW